MSHAMAASGAGSAVHAPPAVYRRAGAALAAEWIKLRSLRSMLLTPLLGAVAFIGLADGTVRNNAAGEACPAEPALGAANGWDITRPSFG